MEIKSLPLWAVELKSNKFQGKSNIFRGTEKYDTFEKRVSKPEIGKSTGNLKNVIISFCGKAKEPCNAAKIQNKDIEKLKKADFNEDEIGILLKVPIGMDDAIKLKSAGFNAVDIDILLISQVEIDDAIKLKSAGFNIFDISDISRDKKLNEVEQMLECGFIKDEIKQALKYKIDINRAIVLKNRYESVSGIDILKLVKSNIPLEKTDTMYKSETGIDFNAVAFFNFYNANNLGVHSKTQDLQRKIQLIDTYNSLSNLTKENINYLYGKDIAKEIEELEKSITHIIMPTAVSKEDYAAAFKKFFANNNDIENRIKTADFANFGKDGLKLQISREKFLSDLSKITADLDPNEQSAIFNKLGIEIIKGPRKTIAGYNGIIDLTKLSKEGIEGEILKKASDFILNNKIETGDTKLDEALNGLIKSFPEFINIIGKKQHAGHSYTLDIHMLEVLKRAMNNPEYENLSNKDKICLKIAAIFHDIAKEEGKKDEGEHTNLSARYVKDILEKSSTLSQDMKDRIYELINNHHWLQKYDNGKDAETTACSFRHKNDYTISKILAASDIKSINGDEHNCFLSALSKEKQAPVQEVLNKINSTGQIIFTTKPVFEVPQIAYTSANGTKYNLRVVNFSEIPNDTDLRKFGFLPGTKKEDVRFLVHMTDVGKGIQTVDKLQDISQGGYLCTSYVSPNNSPTFDNLRFGLSIEAENENIANAFNGNICSGTKKDFFHFVFALTSDKSDERNYMPKIIKQKLDLSDEEYSILYEKIASKRFSTQIDDNSVFKIGDKKLTGKKIKEVISEANNSLFNGKNHSEVNVYNPKINGVVAKVNSLDEVPSKLLDFAQTHDLPIYLLGK